MKQKTNNFSISSNNANGSQWHYVFPDDKINLKDTRGHRKLSKGGVLQKDK